MTKTMRAILPVVLLLIPFNRALAHSMAASPWSERGVFAFFDLVYDFQKGLEISGPVSYHLSNCSDQSYFCAEAGRIHLVLPRTCGSISVGQSWKHDGVITSVLSEHEHGAASLETFGPQTVYLLGQQEFPHIVYEYTVGNGVIGIYFDPKFDIVAAAVKGDMTAYDKWPVYHELVTLDKFGACSR